MGLDGGWLAGGLEGRDCREEGDKGGYEDCR